MDAFHGVAAAHMRCTLQPCCLGRGPAKVPGRVVQLYAVQAEAAAPAADERAVVRAEQHRRAVLADVALRALRRLAQRHTLVLGGLLAGGVLAARHEHTLSAREARNCPHPDHKLDRLSAPRCPAAELATLGNLAWSKHSGLPSPAAQLVDGCAAQAHGACSNSAAAVLSLAAHSRGGVALAGYHTLLHRSYAATGARSSLLAGGACRLLCTAHSRTPPVSVSPRTHDNRSNSLVPHDKCASCCAETPDIHTHPKCDALRPMTTRPCGVVSNSVAASTGRAAPQQPSPLTVWSRHTPLTLPAEGQAQAQTSASSAILTATMRARKVLCNSQGGGRQTPGEELYVSPSTRLPTRT